jgi:hypothetical protein
LSLFCISFRCFLGPHLDSCPPGVHAAACFSSHGTSGIFDSGPSPWAEVTGGWMWKCPWFNNLYKVVPPR